MVVSEVVTLFFYVISIAFLPAYFGMNPFCPRRKKQDLTIACRPLVCCHPDFCLESRCHCGYQCSSAVHLQAYKEEDSSCGIE